MIPVSTGKNRGLVLPSVVAVDLQPQKVVEIRASVEQSVDGAGMKKEVASAGGREGDVESRWQRRRAFRYLKPADTSVVQGNTW